MQITADSFAVLYDNSPMASAAVDMSGRILYKNPAFSALFEGLAADFSDICTGRSYERYVRFDGRTFRLYVSSVSDEISLVNVTEESSISEEYYPVLCAAVRNAVSVVASASDSIHSACSEDVSALLNTIDGTMLTLLSEFLVPEEIYQLESMSSECFEVVSVSDSMRKYVDELGEIFSRYTLTITENISAGMYAKVDMRAIRLLLTDFAVRTMEGEYSPESICIRLERYDEDAMKLTLSCGYLMKLPAAYSRAVKKHSDYAPFERLKEIICEKFKCRTEYRSSADLSSISVYIPMCDAPYSDGLRSPQRNFISSSRFSDEKAYMSRFDVYPRYSN